MILSYPDKQINNIKFSLREIDIISCVLNMRGAKKIANILQISHRTVERHIQNVMLKIGCNNQEGITDFIEKSSQLLQLKKHYTSLLINSFFQNQLIKVSPHIKRKNLSCNVSASKDLKQETKLLEKHLELLGIKKSDQNFDFNIRLLPKASAKTEKDNTYNILLENYYSDFFQMLLSQFPEMNFTTAIDEFKHLEENTEEIKNDLKQRIIANIQNEVDLTDVNEEVIKEPEKSSPRKYLFNYPRYVIVTSIVILLVMTSFILYYLKLNNIDKNNTVSSSLSIPHSSNILKREFISKKIFELIKFSNDHITTIALTGVGGAGKTTAAKQFARNYNADITWELNANNKESLLKSLEELAIELCNTENCQKEFSSIQSQKDTDWKLKRYMSIVSRNLYSRNNWLLIFDNFETNSLLSEYLPDNHKIWGNGIVIITTRDTDIRNQNYIDEQNVIEVRNLSSSEKQELFAKLLSRKVEHSNELHDFLQHIPPYPLDIILASNYINKHHTDFDDYIEKIVNHKNDNTAQDIGKYSDTRYAIIATSIKNIINQHPEFTKHLLHVGLIDSNFITKNYLEFGQDYNEIKQFINYMLSNSIIEKYSDKSSNDAYMIHKTTQQIILDYLIKNLPSSELEEYICQIATKLRSFIIESIDNDRVEAIKISTHHAESLFNHTNNRFPIYNPITATSLANCYFYLGDNKRAAYLLEQYANSFDIETIEGRNEAVNNKVILGNIYSNIGQYDKAAVIFNEAINLILSDTNNSSILAWTKVNFARLQIKLGKYDDAKHLLSDAFEVYKEFYGLESPETAWVMSYYGNLLIEIGEFEQSERLLLATHDIIKKYFGDNHIRTATTLNDLSHLYIHTGNYTKANHLLGQSKKIHDKFFDEQNPNSSWLIFNLGLLHGRIGQIQQGIEYLNKSYANHLEYHDNDYVTKRDLVELASLYADVGNYDRGIALLDQSLEEYKKQFGSSHNKVAELYNKYARIHLHNDKTEEALDFIRKSVAIFKKNNHPQIYISYVNLADYYLKNYNNEAAVNYLEKAEKILRANYPIDSEITKNIIAKKNKILSLI